MSSADGSSIDTGQLIDSLAPIVCRVRTDVSAIKSNGRISVRRRPLCQEDLARHVQGGEATGLYPIKPGESTTRVGLFDLDSHRGEVSWDGMASVGQHLIEVLRGRGFAPVPFRSSGGAGIHIYLVWDQPQDARAVRQAMAAALAEMEFKSGTGGVKVGEIEIFPKQDQVLADGYGNMFILPLAKESVPLDLDSNLDPLTKADAAGIDWLWSAPPPAASASAPSVRPMLAVGAVDCDLERLASALSAIPNDDEGLPYEAWRNIIFGIHHAASGSDDGYELALQFSMRSWKFEENELKRCVWDHATRTSSRLRRPVTALTVFAMARKHGWVDPARPKDPPVDPKDFIKLATMAFSECWSGDGGGRLRRSDKTWYAYQGNRWAGIDEEGVRGQVWSFLNGLSKLNKDGEIEPFRPTKHQVDSVMDPLRTVVVPKAPDAWPCWLDGVDEPEASRMLALQDGLLDIQTRTLVPHTPAFFSQAVLPYRWGSEEVAPPARWLQFLESLWPDDPESIATMQELFGYLLTCDTSQQKMFLIIGPRRSGKGTIGRLLQELVGKENCAGPTLSNLARDFGLETLIGKQLAILSDVRFGRMANSQMVVERLLMISGEDTVSIDRKNRTALTCKLNTRLLMLTNEAPDLRDASGALASRFIVVAMRASFLGKEDFALDDDLKAELPAILRWSLDGLDRLRSRGRFIQPASANDEVELLSALTAPVHAPVQQFVNEECELGAAYEVPFDELFQAWVAWRAKEGLDYTGSSQSFGRQLKAAVAVQTVRPSATEAGPARQRRYRGLRLIKRDRTGFSDTLVS